MWAEIVFLIGTAAVQCAWADSLPDNLADKLDALDIMDVPDIMAVDERNDPQPCPPNEPLCNTDQRLEKCDRHWVKLGCYNKMDSVMLLDDRHMEQDSLNEFYSKDYYTDVNDFEASTHSLACRCAKLAKMKGYRYFSLRYWGMCHAIVTGNMLDALDNPKASSSDNCASSKGLMTKCDPMVETECLGMEADFVYSLYKMDPIEDKNINGGLSPWTPWGKCNVTCGTGTQTRTRTCTNPPPKGNGLPCRGPLDEDRECTECDCPVDGNWSEWSSFTICSKTCGGGSRTKRRTCTNPSPDKGGKDCEGDDAVTERCELAPCPIHGCYSEWSPYGACSKTCGDGTKSRYRQCNNPAPAHEGSSCAHLGNAVEIVKCNDKPCPIDGGFTKWTKYSRCSKSCGGGKEARIRMCTNPSPQYGGLDCVGASTETIDCNTLKCPQNGGWTDWIKKESVLGEMSVWTPCSRSCGGGVRSKSRTCTNPPPMYGGASCVGDATVQEACNTQMCGEPGIWSHWSPYSECSFWCRQENGPSPTMERQRSCTAPAPKFGGKHCPGPATETAKCNEDFFCPIDGGYTEWGEWSPCTKQCKKWDDVEGQQTRTRACTNPAPRHGGFDCEMTEGVASETTSCNTQPCAEWKNWGSWSDCSKTCEGGKKTRTRTCVGGDDCRGPTSETTDCETQPCPVNGNWGQWTAFTVCSKPCGQGHKNRSRKCDRPAANYGGSPCPGLNFESTPCQIKLCPIDGQWSSWSKFGRCSKSCKGGGLMMRTRDCGDPEPKHGGKKCPPRADGVLGVEKKPCKEDVPCPVDCVWNNWQPWRRCSRSCGKGLTARMRTNTPAQFGGNCFGRRFERNFCNTQHCPINGNWGGWSRWGACSKSCGGGVQQATRRCDNPVPQYEGCKQCPGEDKRTRECTPAVRCPVDGKYGEWTNWSSCTQVCGGGTRTRTRVCTPPQYGGLSCRIFGESEEMERCNNQVCDREGMACACQGEGAKLSCKLGNGKIHIKQNHDVYYGRTDQKICGDTKIAKWSYNCRSGESGKQKVAALCEGKQECVIPVNNDFFGNPCPGTYKYLRVHYECRGNQYEEVRHNCGKCLHAENPKDALLQDDALVESGAPVAIESNPSPV